MFGWSQERRAIRVWVGTIALFMISFVQSCSELKSSIWGKVASADVTAMGSALTKGRSVLAFQFRDETGKSHFVKKSIPTKLGPFEPGQKVEVIYFSGAPERARLVSERSFVWPAIFLGMLAFGLVWMFVTYKRMEAGKF